MDVDALLENPVESKVKKESDKPKKDTSKNEKLEKVRELLKQRKMEILKSLDDP